MERPERDRIPAVNDIVKGENNRVYKLHTILGDGGYGTVFDCHEGEKRFALKVEKHTKSMLHIEVKVMKEANARKCQHICEIYDHGSHKPAYSFIVMTLLGPDLHRLKNEQPDRHFTLGTAVRIGFQSCKGIEELHRCGFLSRDVKPGNFAVGLKENNQHRCIFMIDFGLSRKYVDKNGNVLPSRKEVGWRGTTRYGSIQAHQRMDLGRRDDLESWFYMLIEVTKGSLPWRSLNERSSVYAAKLAVRNTSRTQFLDECPKQYDHLLTSIDGLTFDDTPKYEEIYKVLEEMREESGTKLNARFDWEEEITSTARSVTTSLSDREQRANNVERPAPDDLAHQT